ncbi:MAG: Replicative DNA helicase [Candidatus Saccharicenans subterraneus]|uniref:Replicative DNA helicase n=1 Tax=Candidatus Saccharicenans subterraneus TaxID=2508984 RepID=A0A3E2BQ62_9BACT|nr:MAG: Replicative DNA helicase [Candidatus Saccharicenans subterraneum]
MELDLTVLKKTPPHSLEAEKTVLGGVLVNNAYLNVVLSQLSPEDFYRDAHRQILEGMVALMDRGQPIDLLTLSDELQRRGLLEEIGGAAYLSSLMDGVPRTLNIEYYAQIIKEKSLLRKLILSSAKIINTSYEQQTDADTVISEAQQAIVEIAEEKIKPGLVPIGSLTGDMLETIRVLAERREAVTGVPTGFIELDNLTGGFHPSDFIVVAARPSMGKTALALNICQHVGLRTDYYAGFFSIEMAKEQVALRLLCAEAQVDLRKARSGFISERDFERLQLAAETLAQARIYVDESAALTVMEMKAKCRRLKLEGHLDIVFVDYIQLMRTGGRFENRNQEMSFISRSLKELAKELRIPVVGVSQLSRAPEKMRKEPKPMLSDLRESGAIEQDADVVIFIYRPDYYHPEDEAIKGIAEVTVAKQRNGPLGSVPLVFLREYAKFVNMDFSYKREEEF